MCKLLVYVLSPTDDRFNTIPNATHLVKVHLGKLPIGEFQNNRIYEARIFLSDLTLATDAEYIGIASDSWDRKFSIKTKLIDLNNVELSPSMVKVAWRTPNWLDGQNVHPGIQFYLNEIAQYLGVKIKNEPAGCWCNCFLMHKLVYLDFMKFFRKAFNYCYNKWGLEYEFEAGHQSHDHCKVALITECFVCMYLTNHPELRVEQLP